MKAGHLLFIGVITLAVCSILAFFGIGPLAPYLGFVVVGILALILIGIIGFIIG